MIAPCRVGGIINKLSVPPDGNQPVGVRLPIAIEQGQLDPDNELRSIRLRMRRIDRALNFVAIATLDLQPDSNHRICLAASFLPDPSEKIPGWSAF